MHQKLQDACAAIIPLTVLLVHLRDFPLKTVGFEMLLVINTILHLKSLLTPETPGFITPALWPANSPDLNPVNYQIWGKLQEHVYRSQIRDVDQLKSCLVEDWEHFHQVVIDVRRSGSGVHVFELAFEHMVDILNTDFRCADVLPFARTHN